MELDYTCKNLSECYYVSGKKVRVDVIIFYKKRERMKSE